MFEKAPLFVGPAPVVEPVKNKFFESKSEPKPEPNQVNSTMTNSSEDANPEPAKKTLRQKLFKGYRKLSLIATVLLSLTASSIAFAATVEDRELQLSQATNVIAVQVADAGVPLFGGLVRVEVAYAYLDPETEVVNNNRADLIVVDYTLPTEEAYWFTRIPAPLVTPPTVTYFSDRTISTITAAQIESFCNTAWKSTTAQGGANQVGAANIRKFNVQPVDGLSVQISGLFQIVADGSWEHRVYLIRLTEANAPTNELNLSSGKIKFERLTE